MQALVYDPDAPHGLRLGDAPDPQPGASQVLVEVHATSLNFGELAFLRDRKEPGDVAGWDAAGTVITAAADGSGPPAGARVVTFGWAGAWAQRRGVDTTQLAVLPDTVEFTAAAALPVAAVTALRAVRRLGPLLGRRILITGASGGVGRFAVQLAARAGASVVAVVGSRERGAGLSELGATEVAVGVGGLTGTFDGALDNVGGRMLADVYGLLATEATALSIGMASLEPTTIDFEAARIRAGGSRIEAFSVGDQFGEDLAYLVGLLAAGQLDPQVDWRGSWDRASEAAGLLLGRRVRGKAVLEVR
jgi:NADPH:quinone reductase-like Zn-dependent oxidoreductase